MTRIPNYLQFDRAVYFPNGIALDIEAPILGPGYTVRRDAVILHKGTDAPDLHRKADLALLAHAALYHAIASGRLPRRLRGQVDWLLPALMKAQGVGPVACVTAWLYVRLCGTSELHRLCRAMCAGRIRMKRR